MNALTKEEFEELTTLEKEETDRLEAKAAAAKRQHLDALRMKKRLSAKHGEPGKDFDVLETLVGNIAIRRPNEVEIDGIDEGDGRDKLEPFAASMVIEPDVATVQKLMAQEPGLCNALTIASTRMLKVLQEESSKK